jgi:PhzF family phenazine biosynthesis protein
MMKTRPFQQVDVFTAAPYRGNPLAVVLDGTDLDDAELQRFAQWTNLSETTFLLPPTDSAADYRVRIFTPGSELPFAGDRIVQQSAVGLVAIRRDGERLAFAAPPVTRSAPSPSVLARVAAALGLKAAQIRGAQMLDNGPVWLGLLLDDVDTVLALKPDHRALKELRQKVGVAAVPHATEEAPALIGRSNREARAFGARAQPTPVGLEVRAFAAPIGVEEDPVTGSFNASIAQWLIADGHVPERYVAGQGQCMGRDGRVHIERDADGQVWVGGDAVTCIEGSVHL